MFWVRRRTLAWMDIGHLTRRKTRGLWTSDKDKYEDKTMHCMGDEETLANWGKQRSRK